MSKPAGPAAARVPLVGRNLVQRTLPIYSKAPSIRLCFANMQQTFMQLPQSVPARETLMAAAVTAANIISRRRKAAAYPSARPQNRRSHGCWHSLTSAVMG